MTTPSPSTRDYAALVAALVCVESLNATRPPAERLVLSLRGPFAEDGPARWHAAFDYAESPATHRPAVEAWGPSIAEAARAAMRKGEGL